jgi:hypothetical protein
MGGGPEAAYYTNDGIISDVTYRIIISNPHAQF